jgi:hypothetical protein
MKTRFPLTTFSPAPTYRGKITLRDLSADYKQMPIVLGIYLAVHTD